MSDGQNSADIIGKQLECYCSVDDAIEIEQRLFTKLTSENTRYREALERIEKFDCKDSYERSYCGECPSCIANDALEVESE